MKTLAITTTCDARGCGTAPAMPYDLARQFGLPRSIDLCAQHAAPLEALLAQSNAEHGTVTRYQDGCRCMDCRRSATRRRQVERLRARARGLSPQDPRHGTNNAYTNLACRCEPCRTAAQEHRNAATRPLQLTGRAVSA